MNKTCSNKQTNINIMSELCSGKINKTRYDDLGKPMKQTSFIVKNLGGTLPKKQSTIVKKSFRSSIKYLSLDSTISVDELTAEPFYRFKTSELFNIWTPPFWTDPSTWLTNDAWLLVRNQHTNYKKMLAAKFFTSSTMKIKKHLVTKP